ncbi:MAG: glutaredoxin family protein [Thermodesulfobacteriota bacterium]
MPENVFLYALSTCVHCKNAKELLDRKGVDYDYCYVDKLTGEERQNAIEEIKKYNPGLSFPTIIIDDKCIVGYKEQEIEQALEK